ncbi:MAG TPA: hypothetical protein VFU02_18570 [Polyangiaceae bacterium]|nr:hypothetical protein [Polyangiaceae bacterium]
MQRTRHWTAGMLVVCALATGASGCGGESSGDGDGDGDGDSNGTSAGSGGATSGGSGGSSSASGGASSGSNQASSSSTGAPMEVEEYSAEAASIVCEWLAPCCGGIGLSVSQADCSAALEAQISADYASADPDNYSYDAELASDCFATARDLYRDLGCDLSMAPGDVDPDVTAACDRVFTGKLEPGEPCASDIECTHGPDDSAECTQLDTDDTVCVVERRAAEGESCYWTCTEMGSGYFCSGAGGETPALQGRCFTNDQLYCGDAGVCARAAALGESCVSDTGCAEGYCLDGVCSPAGDTGDTCQLDSECAQGLYCEATACAPKKSDGAACEFSNECQSESCADSTCSDASGGDIAIALLCAVASGAQP